MSGGNQEPQDAAKYGVMMAQLSKLGYKGREGTPCDEIVLREIFGMEAEEVQSCLDNVVNRGFCIVFKGATLEDATKKADAANALHQDAVNTAVREDRYMCWVKEYKTKFDVVKP